MKHICSNLKAGTWSFSNFITEYTEHNVYLVSLNWHAQPKISEFTIKTYKNAIKYKTLRIIAANAIVFFIITISETIKAWLQPLFLNHFLLHTHSEKGLPY